MVQDDVRRHRLVWLPTAVASLVYLLVIAIRIDQFGILWFVHLGRQMLHASTDSDEIGPELGWESEVGYDGQYYYAVAVDPVDAASYMPEGIAGIVYARPLYPALAWAASLGDAGAVPEALLTINLVAVLVGTLALSSWLARQGQSPWFALLYAFYPGLIYSVFRDLTEPLAWGLAAAALWTFDVRDRRRVLLAGGLLALAALARETVFLFALAGAALLLRSADEGRWRHRFGPSLYFITLTLGPLLAWKLAVTAAVDETAQGSPGGLQALVPFSGIAAQWPWDRQHVLTVCVVVLPTLVVSVLAVSLLRARMGRVCAWLLLGNAVLFVFFLPAAVYVDFGAASRAAIGVVVATLVCIPAWAVLGERRGRPISRLSLVWAVPLYALVATALGFRAHDLITL